MSKSRDIKKRNKRIALAKRNGWMPGDPILATVSEAGTVAPRVQSSVKSGGTVTATIVAAPQETDQVTYTDIEEPPSRAACRVCGKSQKVTKAGLIGKHGDCAGAGQAYDR